MKRVVLIAGLLVLAGCSQDDDHINMQDNGHGDSSHVSSQDHHSKSVQWGYSGHGSPEHWGELKSGYWACAEGKNQSPINLTDFVDADLPPITFNYRADGNQILNNGHTVQVNYFWGSGAVVDGQTFELKQFHFHAPSENHIDGKSFPMEAHLVHANAEGDLAVVAVMFEEGAENPALAQAWAHMPEQTGDKHNLPERINAEDLLPTNRDYYRFSGSLTTPPCSEGVRWLVMKTPITASKEQIDHFTHVMHHPNNRPVQQTNMRPIVM